jgi:hypothetical protein
VSWGEWESKGERSRVGMELNMKNGLWMGCAEYWMKSESSGGLRSIRS